MHRSAFAITLVVVLVGGHPTAENKEDAVFFPDDAGPKAATHDANSKHDTGDSSGGVGVGSADVATAAAGAATVHSCSSHSRSALPHAVDLSNKTEACFDLATQGPCAEDQWFVLDTKPDEKGRPRGVCKLRPCPPAAAASEGTGGGRRQQVMFNGTCLEEESSAPCPPGMELLANPFGEGQCDCRPDFIPFVSASDQVRHCFQEYLQGPCPPGHQLLDLSYDEEFLAEHPVGTDCVAHLCGKDSQVRWKNDACVEGVTCAANELASFNNGTRQLECGSGLVVRQLLVIPVVCQDGQSLNHDGQCKDDVEFGRAGGNKRPPRLATGNLGLEKFLMQRFGSN